MLILLLGYTGLRWGEATALRICDIDLGRRRIDVGRAFSDVGGHVVLGSPKSHQSRTVPVPRFLVREIADVIIGQQADQLIAELNLSAAVRPTTLIAPRSVRGGHAFGLSA